MPPKASNAPFEEPDWDLLRQKKLSISLEIVNDISDLSVNYLQSEAAEFSENDLISNLYQLVQLSKRRGKIKGEDRQKISIICSSIFGKKPIKVGKTGDKTPKENEPGKRGAPPLSDMYVESKKRKEMLEKREKNLAGRGKLGEIAYMYAKEAYDEHTRGAADTDFMQVCLLKAAIYYEKAGDFKNSLVYDMAFASNLRDLHCGNELVSICRGFYDLSGYNSRDNDKVVWQFFSNKVKENLDHVEETEEPAKMAKMYGDAHYIFEYASKEMALYFAKRAAELSEKTGDFKKAAEFWGHAKNFDKRDEMIGKIEKELGQDKNYRSLVELHMGRDGYDAVSEYCQLGIEKAEKDHDQGTKLILETNLLANEIRRAEKAVVLALPEKSSQMEKIRAMFSDVFNDLGSAVLLKNDDLAELKLAFDNLRKNFGDVFKRSSSQQIYAEQIIEQLDYKKREGHNGELLFTQCLNFWGTIGIDSEAFFKSMIPYYAAEWEDFLSSKKNDRFEEEKRLSMRFPKSDPAEYYLKHFYIDVIHKKIKGLLTSYEKNAGDPDALKAFLEGVEKIPYLKTMKKEDFNKIASQVGLDSAQMEKFVEFYDNFGKMLEEKKDYLRGYQEACNFYQEISPRLEKEIEKINQLASGGEKGFPT